MFKTLKGTYFTCDDVADMAGLTSQTARAACPSGCARPILIDANGLERWLRGMPAGEVA